MHKKPRFLPTHPAVMHPLHESSRKTNAKSWLFSLNHFLHCCLLPWVGDKEWPGSFVVPLEPNELVGQAGVDKQRARRSRATKGASTAAAAARYDSSKLSMSPSQGRKPFSSQLGTSATY